MKYGRPDAYVENVKGNPPASGDSATVAGFVGVCQKGEVNKPILVTSFADFLRKCGGYMNASFLAYAVKGFFDNGGKIAYINRVVKYTDGSKTSVVATLSIKASGDISIATVTASSDGAWAHKVKVEIKDVTSETFTVVVTGDDDVAIAHTDLTMATVEDYFSNNPFIRFTVTDPTKMPVSMPATILAGGADGLVGIADSDYIGDEAKGTGVYAFTGLPVNLLSVAGVTTLAVHQAVSTYCSARGDVMPIIELSINSTEEQAMTYVSTANLSALAFVVYPAVVVADPLSGGAKKLPAGGHVAGLFSRFDSDYGVWQAPAGTEAQVRGILGLERVIKPTEHGLLNDKGINVLRAVEGYGICLWGARTMGKGEDLYVNSVRTKLFVANALTRDLQWAVFQNNDSSTRRKVTATGVARLQDLWKRGAFKGDSQEEAFFFVCNEENNPDYIVDGGQLIADVGIATQKPSEFVIIRLALK